MLLIAAPALKLGVTRYMQICVHCLHIHMVICIKYYYNGMSKQYKRDILHGRENAQGKRYDWDDYIYVGVVGMSSSLFGKQ